MAGQSSSSSPHVGAEQHIKQTLTYAHMIMHTADVQKKKTKTIPLINTKAEKSHSATVRCISAGAEKGNLSHTPINKHTGSITGCAGRV